MVFRGIKLLLSLLFFSGGQSDQGYDSLSKEEERLCSRESDSTPLVEDKGQRHFSELWILCHL